MKKFESLTENEKMYIICETAVDGFTSIYRQVERDKCSQEMLDYVMDFINFCVQKKLHYDMEMVKDETN